MILLKKEDDEDIEFYTELYNKWKTTLFEEFNKYNRFGADYHYIFLKLFANDLRKAGYKVNLKCCNPFLLYSHRDGYGYFEIICNRNRLSPLSSDVYIKPKYKPSNCGYDGEY
jgi:hypothetical protein